MRKTLSAALSLLLLGLGLAAPVTRAQLMDGMSGVVQDGRLVGMVWVPPVADPCHYVEYWYLGPHYVYPNSAGAGETIDTVLRPLAGGDPFRDRSEFFGYARTLLPGGKRVVVSATELERCGPGPS